MQAGQEALYHRPGDQLDPAELCNLVGVKKIGTLYHESISPRCTSAVRMKVAEARNCPEIQPRDCELGVLPGIAAQPMSLRIPNGVTPQGR